MVDELTEKRFEREGAKGAKGKENALSNDIIGAAIEVHRHLGVGLLESGCE